MPKFDSALVQDREGVLIPGESKRSRGTLGIMRTKAELQGKGVLKGLENIYT